MVTIRVLSVLTVLVSLASPQAVRAQNVLSRGLWIDRAELAALPMSGTAWSNLYNAAQASCGTVNLSDQEDMTNVCVLAKALVFARTGNSVYRLRVIDAIRQVVNSGVYSGRALALGRELGTYPIAADLIDLKSYDPVLDRSFRSKITQLLTTRTDEGPASLIACHEQRPNNWGNHCGASRAAVAAYLGDTAQLARIAQVFKGYLGDRNSFTGFRYGTDLSWQCAQGAPVGINPMGCRHGSADIDGVLPDDQRRAGSYTWPPPKENYVYEGLQGALAQAAILKRAGYDVFNWQDRALLRAVKWLHNVAKFPAVGDDIWQMHLVNYYYAGVASFPASTPTRPGKAFGWTDWTHQGKASSSSSGGGSTPTPSPSPSPVIGTFQASADSFVRGGTTGSTNYGTSQDLDVKDSTASTSTYHRRAFVQFRPGTGGSIGSATLKVYVRSLPNGTPAPVCVFAVSSDSWSEGGITWSNQPSAGSSLACKSISSTGWVTWDVSSFVRAEVGGDGVVSFMLRDSSESNRMATFSSRETSNGPVLQVN